MEDTWTGEDTETEAEAEAEVRIDPDCNGDNGGTTGPDVDAEFGAEPDTDTDADGVAEAVPDRGNGLDTTPGTGVTTTTGGGEGSPLAGISRRVAGTGRTVTILTGRAAGEFCWAGAGFSSLASWLNARPTPFWRRSSLRL